MNPTRLRSRILVAVLATGSGLSAQALARPSTAHFPLDSFPIGTLTLPELDAILCGDLDRDGDVDLVALGRGIRTFANDGHDAMRLAWNQPNLGFLRSGALADVDGDGDLDLVAGHGSTWPASGGQAGPLRLFVNSGLGDFADVTATRMPSSNWVHGPVIAADYDRDGDLDLATTPRSAGGIRLLDNDGTGAFSDATAARLPSPLPSATFFDVLEAVDGDGDGDLDLLLSTGPDAPTPAVVLLRNDGIGNFVDATATLPSSTTRILTALDLDSDGDVDLVRENDLLRNDGAGAFQVATIGAGFAPGVRAVAHADLNGDGRVDLIADSGRGDGSLPEVHLSRIDGTFEIRTDWLPSHLRDRQALGVQSPVFALIGGAALAVADLDRDGFPDLLHAGWKTAGSSWTQGLPPKVLFNLGGIGLGEGTRRPMPLVELETTGVIAGDLDGDGDPDLVLGQNVDRVMRNRGDGSFAIGEDIPGVGFFRTGALVDIDGDGDLDFLRSSTDPIGAPFPVSIARNDGGGQWTSIAPPSPADGAASIAAGDLDQDGDLDVVLGRFDWGLAPASTRLWINDGQGVFLDATATRLALPARATVQVALADLDADGDLDLVELESRFVSGTLRLSLNDGSATFTDVSATRLPAVTGSRFALLDEDHDGDLDLILPGSTLSNDGNANFTRSTNGVGDFQQLVDVSGDGVLREVTTDADGIWVGNQQHRWCYQTKHVALAVDVDLDGDLDIVGASSLESPAYAYGLVPDILQNHHRHLAAETMLRVGRPWRLTIGTHEVGATALVFLAPAPANPRISVPPFGSFGLDPASSFSLAPIAVGSGQPGTELRIDVPNSPALIGAPVYAQALIVPSSGHNGARLTGRLGESISR